MTELLYSVVSKIHWGIKRVFYSGVYTDTWEDIGDGGPTCFNEMTVEFRVIIAIIMVNTSKSRSLTELGYRSVFCTQAFQQKNE